MINIVLLLFLLAIVFHLASYGRWAWRNNYRRGAYGIFIVAWITLALPVIVWSYHHFR
ncbi:MAG: hypothetical protein IMW93_00400 [Thermoanaerobacteraceae bacterium]|nr:hypothetical protein [Thermoanaerobacteraceae bacterium]